MKRVFLTALSGLAILTAATPAALAQSFPRQRYNHQFDPQFNHQQFGRQDRFRGDRFDDSHFQNGGRFRGQGHFRGQRNFRSRNRRFRGRDRGFERLVRFKFGRRNRF